MEERTSGKDKNNKIQSTLGKCSIGKSLGTDLKLQEPQQALPLRSVFPPHTPQDPGVDGVSLGHHGKGLTCSSHTCTCSWVWAAPDLGSSAAPALATGNTTALSRGTDGMTSAF